ncbi:hypothetical protein SUGI_1125700 [Cryptomeria japonica]|nr:hypothetical protein SUGI_1125700 [Cryptomeria japonica]
MYGGVCSELLCIALALFWAAINAGGRVDSVLKDMAIAAFKGCIQTTNLKPQTKQHIKSSIKTVGGQRVWQGNLYRRQGRQWTVAQFAILHK